MKLCVIVTAGKEVVKGEKEIKVFTRRPDVIINNRQKRIYYDKGERYAWFWDMADSDSFHRIVVKITKTFEEDNDG